MSYRNILRLIQLPVSALCKKKNTIKSWQYLPRRSGECPSDVPPCWLIALITHVALLDLSHSTKGQMSPPLLNNTAQWFPCMQSRLSGEWGENRLGRSGLLCVLLILNFLTWRPQLIHQHLRKTAVSRNTTEETIVLHLNWIRRHCCESLLPVANYHNNKDLMLNL